MNIDNKIPTSTIQATIALLSPYVAEISPTNLIKAIKEYGNNQKSPLGNKPLTRQEVADYLGVSLVTVNRYLNIGLLQRIKLTRGCVKISVESVQKLLEQGVN